MRKNLSKYRLTESIRIFVQPDAFSLSYFNVSIETYIINPRIHKLQWLIVLLVFWMPLTARFPISELPLVKLNKSIWRYTSSTRKYLNAIYIGLIILLPILRMMDDIYYCFILYSYLLQFCGIAKELQLQP